MKAALDRRQDRLTDPRAVPTDADGHLDQVELKRLSDALKVDWAAFNVKTADDWREGRVRGVDTILQVCVLTIR